MKNPEPKMDVIFVRMDALEAAIRTGNIYRVQWEYDRVLRALTKFEQAYEANAE